MLIVICLVFLGLGIVCVIKDNAKDGDNGWTYTGTISFVLLIVAFIMIIFYGVDLSGRMVINDKIEMYQTQNNQIQNEISIIVENYKDYEKSTLSNLKTESPITLATLFPDLKSNELVKKQIDLYISNNAKINDLKESKINKRVIAWWVYFGC